MARDFRSLDGRFAEGFRMARQQSDLSQEKVAEEMRALGFEMSQPVVGKIERGDRKVSIGEAEALASVLGVHVAMLLSGPSIMKVEYAVRHMKSLVDDAKLALTKFQSGQMALASLADGIGHAELSPYYVDEIERYLDMRPADVVRALELDNIEVNVGQDAREQMEAAEDRMPEENRYAAGYADLFFEEAGQTMNRTIGAPGFFEALAAFGQEPEASDGAASDSAE